MSADRTELLFNRQPFREVAEALKAQIVTDVTTYYSYRTARGTDYREELIRKYTVGIPMISSKVASVQGSQVKYSINFDDANGSFFNYWPEEKVSADRPEGDAIANCVMMYFPNNGDAASIKKAFKEKYDDFITWFEAVKAEVQDFNSKVPSYIDDAIKNHQDKSQQIRALEDELNS